MNTNAKPVIMAVDDDPVILGALAVTLKQEFSVRPFTSGIDALKYLAGDHDAVDLILLDNLMPKMSGFEVLLELLDDPAMREIPTIFLSGASDSDSEVAALELGAADYITKPIHPKLLLTRVKLQLELQRHRKQLEALVGERTKSLDSAYNKLKAREEIALNMLARATDLRDHDTGGHLERTTGFVRVIVEDLLDNPQPGYTVSKTGADDIIHSSKLHDIGKIALPDHILLKKERLTTEEYTIVKQHTTNGERFFNEFMRRMDDSFLDTARDVAHLHHERWDGRGYPLGISGEAIPLSARIVAIADVYDALTTARPYRAALSHERAALVIIKSGGAHFDPFLTELFERHADDFKLISERIGAQNSFNPNRDTAAPIR